MSTIYITEPGTYIQKDGGCVVIEKNNDELTRIPLEEVEQIILVRSAQVSSALTKELLERTIPLTWMSSQGKYLGSLVHANGGDILLQEKQFSLLQEKTLYLSLAQKMIIAKIENQRVILQRYTKTLEETKRQNLLTLMKNMAKLITQDTQYQDIMGHEGFAGRVYFEGIGMTMPTGYQFSQRSKQPPLDPFNSMIGFGYSLLFNEIMISVISVGLHPSVGCLHRLKKGHPALVSDLIEEWRAPIIDSLVLSFISKNIMPLSCFTNTPKGCYLSYEAQKKFVSYYHKRMNQPNTYTGKTASYRELIQEQVKNYSKAIMENDSDVYQPFTIR